MGRTVTLQTLQNRVLQRANIRTGTASAAILDAGELTDMVNEAIAEFHTIVTQTNDQRYFLKSVPFVTVSTTDTYAIGPGLAINAPDYHEPAGFDVMFGQNIVITARPFTWSERNRFKWYPGWIYSQPVFYQMIGKDSAANTATLDQVKLIPQPSGQFDVTMWYVPTATVLTQPLDTLDGILGCEEYVVLGAAMKVLEKQERFEHAQYLGAKRAAEMERILGLLMSRDAENPPRVQDVSLNDGWIGRPGY